MEHRIRISVPPGDSFAVVDMFIFEIPDTSTPNAMSSSRHIITALGTSTVEDTTPVPSPTSPNNPEGWSFPSRNIPIAFGIAAMGLALVAIFVFLIWRLRCRKRQDANTPGLPTSAIGGPSTPSTPQGLPIPSCHLNNTPEIRIASVLQSEFGSPTSTALRTYGSFSTTLYPTIWPSTSMRPYLADILLRTS
ncbi:unnamed protein product [Cyclocybe aegerita]|uniref:Uncharacterized protein n=1 Tax=Cyclocybe aegerita TaxID=1973307 RepID=A0A8S0WZT7_CYCAE|nr:unnamed protein product [Cyclocybe aegerita]